MKKFKIIGIISSLILIFSWFRPILNLGIVKLSLVSIMVGMGQISRYFDSIPGVGSDNILALRILLFIVFFILQIISLILYINVPKKNSKKFNTANIVYNSIIIALMVFLMLIAYAGSKGYDVSSVFKLGSICRTQILFEILLIVGIVIYNKSYVGGLESSFGGDLGSIKGAIKSGNRYFKGAIKSGNKYIKNSMTNFNIENIENRIRTEKGIIGSIAYNERDEYIDLARDLFEQMDKKQEELEKKEKILFALDGRKRCGSCETIIPIEANFCPQCSNPVENVDINVRGMDKAGLTSTITRIKKETDKICEAIGNIVYEDNTVEKSDEILYHIDLIDNAKFEINEIEEQHTQTTGKIKCPKCGALCKSDSKFCIYCGASISE